MNITHTHSYLKPLRVRTLLSWPYLVVASTSVVWSWFTFTDPMTMKMGSVRVIRRGIRLNLKGGRGFAFYYDKPSPPATHG